MNGYASFETLVDDRRLARVEDQLRRVFPALPDSSLFVTFIQPATVASTEQGPVDVPDLATLAVISKNPRKGPDIMTQGQMLLTVWRTEDGQYRHFVGVQDPLLLVYRPILRNHLESLASLRELTN